MSMRYHQYIRHELQVPESWNLLEWSGVPFKHLGIVLYVFLGGGFKYFLFSSRTLGNWSNLTNIFQMGWNHQLVLLTNMFDSFALFSEHNNWFVSKDRYLLVHVKYGFASNPNSILEVCSCIICTFYGHPPQKQIGRNSATSWDSLPPSIDLWLDTIKVVIIDLWCMVGYWKVWYYKPVSKASNKNVQHGQVRHGQLYGHVRPRSTDENQDVQGT